MSATVLVLTDQLHATAEQNQRNQKYAQSNKKVENSHRKRRIPTPSQTYRTKTQKSAFQRRFQTVLLQPAFEDYKISKQNKACVTLKDSIKAINIHKTVIV